MFVDTTSSDLIVAIVGEQDVKNFSKPNCGRRHSETLCVCVDEALKSCGLTFEKLDAYACAVGPGSFTGIRIGVSTVKGYCSAVKKPLISVGTLEAIVCSNSGENSGKAVIDAGNGFYFADCQNGVKPCLIPYDDERAADAIRAENASEWFDGAVKLIRERFENKDYCESLSPVYVRRSQAEENR